MNEHAADDDDDDDDEPQPPGFVQRQLSSRPLFDGSGPYGLIILPVVAVFSWMMLVGWGANTRSQQITVATFVAFMWVGVLALVAPNRFRWAPRLLTLAIGVMYAWYVADETAHAIAHQTLAGSSSGTSLMRALLGMVIFGAPSLYFAWYGRFPWTRDPSTSSNADPVANHHDHGA